MFQLRLLEVNKSAMDLKIKIPSNLRRNPFSCGLIGIFLLSIFCPFISLLLEANLHIGLGVFALVISVLVKFYGNSNKITFNRNYFKLEHQIFDWSYLKQTGETSEILGAFIYNNSFGGNQIRIRSGNEIGTYFHVLGNNLKEIEAAWLAQEIQDWLSLR
jgi:hypothetical protein